MTHDELLATYKSNARISRKLEIGTATPQYWRKKGYIPFTMQLLIERKTEGKFVAREEDGRQVDR